MVQRALLFTLLSVGILLAGFSVVNETTTYDGDWIITVNGDPEIFANQYNLPVEIINNHVISGYLNDTQYRSMMSDSRIKSIEPNIIFKMARSFYPQISSAGYLRIGGEAGNSTYSDSDIDIAVIDTGIDMNHPDLNVYRSESFIGGMDGMDDHGHGTHVAGIIGAKDNEFGVVGFAPGCRLWALKVLSSSGSGSLSDVVRALDYVSDYADEIEIVNMSLGATGYSQSLRDAIRRCVDAGVVVVVAAGNNAGDIYGADKMLGTSDDAVPAAYPEVCTVSAMVDTDGMSGGFGNPYVRQSLFGPAFIYSDDTFAWYSNYSSTVVSDNPVVSSGRGIDLAAPGVHVLSTWLGNDYQYASGTSMASPHVVGAVAKYIIKHGRAFNAYGVYAIRQALIDQAESQQAWSIETKDIDRCNEPLVSVRDFDNYWPTLAIASSHPHGIEVGQSITLSAAALDVEDGDLSSLVEWRTIHRLLAIGSLVEVDRLGIGRHVVVATVVDSAGKHASQRFVVNVRPLAPVMDTDVNLDGEYSVGDVVEFSVTLRFGDSPVLDAWISASIINGNFTSSIRYESTPWTGMDGVVSFKYDIHQLDIGVNDIKIVAYKYNKRIMSSIVASFIVK